MHTEKANKVYMSKRRIRVTHAQEKTHHTSTTYKRIVLAKYT